MTTAEIVRAKIGDGSLRLEGIRTCQSVEEARNDLRRATFFGPYEVVTHGGVCLVFQDTPDVIHVDKKTGVLTFRHDLFGNCGVARVMV